MFESVKKNYYVILVAISCCLAFTSLGAALSWPSPCLVKLRQTSSPVHLTTSQESWVGSFLAIGAVVIAAPYTYVFNTSGRKWLIFTIAAFNIAGWTALTFASEVFHIYIGRFLLGCAVGPTYGVIPVYLAEVVSKNVRGANVALLVISQSIGAFFEYSLEPSLSFKVHNTLSMIFPLMLLICSFILPESPYYLISINKEDEAERVLMKLRGTDSCEEVSEEFGSIKKCLEESPPMSYKDLFKELSSSKTKKVIVIITVATFAQQFSGIGAVIVYMQTIFKKMKSPISSKYAVIITELLGNITVFITFKIIDKIGRKPLLLRASLVCVAANLILGFYFILNEFGVISDSWSWVGMIGVFLIQIGYAMGLGPVPMLVMSEIMSFSAKGWISGYFLIVQGIYNATSIKLFQIISDSIGCYYSYWIFAFSILVSVGYLMSYMPETKGKSLQEIQHILSDDENDFTVQKNVDQIELGSLKDLTKPPDYMD